MEVTNPHQESDKNQAWSTENVTNTQGKQGGVTETQEECDKTQGKARGCDKYQGVGERGMLIQVCRKNRGGGAFLGRKGVFLG